MDASTSETSFYLWVLVKTQQMAFFYCALWRQIPCCLKYILCWILTISASRNLHGLQLLVVPYTPIRIFFSWWRRILIVLLYPLCIASSSLVFTHAFHLAVFLFFIFDYYWFLFTFPFNLPVLAVSPPHPQQCCFYRCHTCTFFLITTLP